MKLVGAGVALLSVGLTVLLLMSAQFTPSWLSLALGAYGAAFAGTLMALLGLMMRVREPGDTVSRLQHQHDRKSARGGVETMDRGGASQTQRH